MTRNLANQTVQAALDQAVRRGKLKAFLITSSALFSMVFMFWAMSVDGFVSQSQIRLTIPSLSSNSTEDFDAKVAQKWQEQLTDHQLDNQIEQVAKAVDLKDPVMLGKNFDRVRNSLDYEIRRDPNRRHLSVYLTYKGVGSDAELELVNLMSESIATQFASSDDGTGSFANSVSNLRRSQREALDQMEWLVNQLDADIMQLRNATDAMAPINTDSFSTLPRLTSKQGLRQTGNLDAHDGNQFYQALLRQKLAALIQRKAELLSNTPAPGSLDIVQREIEDVQLELSSSSTQWDDHSVENVRRPVFQNVSHSRMTFGPLAEISDTVDSIDVISLKSTVTQLKQNWEAQEAFHDSSAGSDICVLVENVGQACAQPVGGLPQTATVLSFFLLSMLAGSVVAWNYSPLKEDLGFVDSADVEKKLRIPVITQLVRKSDESTEEEMPLCNLIVELSRLALIVILLVIIFGLVFDSSVRETFSENPLHGLARVMWNLLGK